MRRTGRALVVAGVLLAVVPLGLLGQLVGVARLVALPAGALLLAVDWWKRR